MITDFLITLAAIVVFLIPAELAWRPFQRRTNASTAHPPPTMPPMLAACAAGSVGSGRSMWRRWKGRHANSARMTKMRIAPMVMRKSVIMASPFPAAPMRPRPNTPARPSRPRPWRGRRRGVARTRGAGSLGRLLWGGGRRGRHPLQLGIDAGRVGIHAGQMNS